MSKLKQQLKRAAVWFYNQLPWYGKIILPFVVLALGVYMVNSLADALTNLFV